MNTDREAERVADLIIWRLQLTRKDWSLIAATLGDKLRNAAWNHATRAMLRDKDRLYQPPKEKVSMLSSSPVLDFVGREIKVGDTVCYPVRQGSRMWLSRIRVTQIVADPPTLHGCNPEGRKVKVHKMSNAVVAQPN